MRVAFIAPGSSIHTKRWLESIAARGHEVGLISYGRLGQTIDGAQVLLELEIFSEPGRGRRRLLDLGRAVRRVRHALDRFEPDVVHAHFLTGPGWLGALGGHAPLVVTAWGSDVFVDAKRRPIRRMHELTLRRARLATTESEALQVELIRLGMPSERIARVLWGVNVDLFHPGDAPEELRRELALEPGVPVLLAMRGVRPIQNPETVLRALALLRARGTEAILVLLLGPGGFKALPESLSSELDTLGVRDLVREVGELPHARLAELYRAADVCVSVPTTDSTSIAVLEAMASGCPIVASDIPANREWIDDGREGRLVPAGDETALADALESMLSDPSQLRAMGEAALERVNGVVDERTQMDRVAALYRELTG